MTRSSFAFLLAAGMLSAVAVPAQAHRVWLQPSATTFSGTDAWVTVDAAESTDVFYADHRGIGFDRVKVWAPDGSEGQVQNGANGHVRSTFDVQLDKPGTWRIGVENDRVFGTFKVNGEEWRIGGRGPARGASAKTVASVADIPAGATDVKLTESSSRNSVFVTTGTPTKAVFEPTGKGLEMVPITHPDDLVSDEEASFRYLIDGKPAAGLQVTILPAGKRYIEGRDQIDLTTGADGVLKIKWPRAGMYWVSASTSDQHPSEPRASERRMSYTMTVDVLAP